MSDAELDDLVRGLARVSDADVAGWDLTGPEQEMCEAIMATDPTTTTDSEDDVRERPHPTFDATDGPAANDADVHEISLTGEPPRRRRPVAAALGVAAAAAVLVAGLLIARRPGDDPGTTAPAGHTDPTGAPGTDTDDDTVPRLLVDLPGWEVERVDEQSPEEGEATLTDGEHTLELHWRPTEEHRERVVDFMSSVGGHERTTVLGQPADRFVYVEPGTNHPPDDGTDLTAEQAALGDFTTLWLQGPVGVEARGRFPSVEEYEATLDALVEVDPATFEAALPLSAVPPSTRGDVVDAMVEDIPLPPGIDLDALRGSDVITDRYQLGAEVTRVVTCEWIDAWVAATGAGDAEGVQRAVDAMASSHDWQVLLDMDDEGDWPDVIWQYADALPTDVPFGPGDVFTVGDSYAQGLGCDPTGPAGL